jgi:Flp pilus assembly protein TadG
MTAGRRRAGAGESGQATVELAVLAPLLVAVVFAAAQLLAAGAAAVLADHAAEAAAVALLQGGDPTAAARAAVPGWSRERMTVKVAGRRVRVRLRPPAPVAALGGLLEASREADAGPAPP